MASRRLADNPEDAAAAFLPAIAPKIRLKKAMSTIRTPYR